DHRAQAAGGPGRERQQRQRPAPLPPADRLRASHPSATARGRGGRGRSRSQRGRSLKGEALRLPRRRGTSLRRRAVLTRLASAPPLGACTAPARQPPPRRAPSALRMRSATLVATGASVSSSPRGRGRWHRAPPEGTAADTTARLLLALKA